MFCHFKIRVNTTIGLKIIKNWKRAVGYVYLPVEILKCLFGEFKIAIQVSRCHESFDRP